MSENLANVEMAHKLHEKREDMSDGDGQKERFELRLEILEAFLLAIVAVATAWSGYQSARWDGHSALSFAESTAQRVDGDEEAALGGQELLQDAANLDTWLLAKTAGNESMVKLLERRFSKDYEPAFRAWLKTDPLNNPNAPPGPAYMPEYSNHLVKQSEEKRSLAAEKLKLGVSYRELAEDYVRLTVFLATVLFLIAISQRFGHRTVKFGLLGLAVVATTIIMILLITYPRA